MATTNERELRLHIESEHITDKDVIVGTKRDESFMTRSDSLFPGRKVQIMEVHKMNTNNVPGVNKGPLEQEPESPENK